MPGLDEQRAERAPLAPGADQAERERRPAGRLRENSRRPRTEPETGNAACGEQQKIAAAAHDSIAYHNRLLDFRCKIFGGSRHSNRRFWTRRGTRGVTLMPVLPRPLLDQLDEFRPLLGRQLCQEGERCRRHLAHVLAPCPPRFVEQRYYPRLVRVGLGNL